MRQLYLFDTFDEGYERGSNEGKESFHSVRRSRILRVPVNEEGQGAKTVVSASGQPLSGDATAAYKHWAVGLKEIYHSVDQLVRKFHHECREQARGARVLCSPQQFLIKIARLNSLEYVN